MERWVAVDPSKPLDEAKIAVVPWGKHHIRLSYANAYANLQQAMDQMAGAIDKLMR